MYLGCLISTGKMVRNYVRKTNNASYPLEKLLEAVRAVKSGRLSGYEASKHYGIPRSTIINRVYDRKGLKSNTLGRATVLSREVEEDLVKNLRVMEKYGFGLTRKELIETVGEHVSANLVKNPFKNGVPGEDWFLCFKKRHNLSIKKPQPVEYARKIACSPQVIYPYFDLLEETVNELGLSDKPSHVWNVDETSFSKDPSKSKVVGCKGFTSTRTIASPGKDNTTVLLGCNALGEKTPPMIVFKGKNVWDQWTTDEGYPGTAYAATSNGWMETPVFEAFFEKVFLKTVGQKRPILLIYDGHATHVGINLIERAREAKITILKIPPHTSHLLQPLDLAVNKSFKDRWDVAILKWQRMNIGKTLPKQEFAKMIGQIWNVLDPSICAVGFRKAGIYPLNKLAVPEDKFNQVLLQEWKQKSAANAAGKEYVNQIAINTKTQEPCTSTQSDPVFEANSPTTTSNTFNPDSLLALSLKILNGMNSTDISIDSCRFHMLQPSQNTCVNISNELTLIDSVSVPSSTNSISEQSPKIQILENRIVTFEDLLLMRIKAGTSSKVKKKRVATGAEVITSEDVYLRTQEAENEKRNKKTKQQDKQAKNKNKIKEVETEKPKHNEKERQIIKKCRKISENLTTSSESETEIKYDENSSSNDYGSNNGSDDENKNKTKQQQKRKKNENKLKEKKSKVPSKPEKLEKPERKTLKTCRKRQKKPISSSESETEIKYDEDRSNNDYGSNNRDDDEKKNKTKHQLKRTKNANKVKNNKFEVPRKHEKQKRNTLKKCRKRQKISTTSSESESEIEIKYDEDSGSNKNYDYWDNLSNGVNDEDDEEKENKMLTKQEENDNDDINNTEQYNIINENCDSDELFCVSDWLLVKFCTKKSVKHYVGVVLSINEVGSPLVKYARRKSKAEGETIFVFPVLDDISEVKHTEDIVTKLQKPAIGRRGQIIFKMTFNSFNIQ